MPISKELMVNYRRNDIHTFIETGTYDGDTVQMALENGFDRLISIELDEQRYQEVRQRFKDENRVSIVKGDSSIVLKDVLQNINEPCFFWLDAHPDIGNTPLINELLVISQHPINSHVILIDDLRLFGPVLWNVSRQSVESLLLLINREYKFATAADHTSPEDVLIAYL